MLRITRSGWLSVLVLGAFVAPVRAWQEQDKEPPKADTDRDDSTRVLTKIRLDLERLKLEELSAVDLSNALPEIEQLEASCREQMKLYKPDHSSWRLLNDTLAQVLVTRIDMLILLGRMEEANACLQELRGTGTRSPEADRIERKLQQFQGSGSGSPDVQSRVEEALRDNDLATVEELGTIAVPALESWILATPGDFSADFGKDPFYLLFRLDRRRAGVFALEHYDVDGYLWKRRIARAVRQTNLFQQQEDFESGGKAPRSCKLPEWMRVLELLVEDPELGVEVMPKVARVMQRAATTPRLEAALLAILALDDARHNAFIDILRQGADYDEDMRRVLETAVTHPSADIRSLAAGRLTSYERSEALLARWNDPEPSVRESVARSFQLRNRNGQSSLPPLIAKDREVFAHLAQDPVASVRIQVLDVLLQRANQIDDTLFQTYTRDPDAKIRQDFVSNIWQSGVPIERSVRLCMGMADDPEERVVRAIDARIDPLINNNSQSFEPVLPLFEARLKSKSFPWRAIHNAGERNGFLGILAQFDASRNWMARTGIEWKDAELLKTVATKDVFFLLSPEITGPYAENLFAIDPEAVERQTREVREGNREHENDRERVARSLIEFARDPALDPRLRFLLAGTDCKIAGTLVADTAIAALSDPRWKKGGPWGDSLWFRKALRIRMEDMPDSEYNRIVLEVLARPDVDPEMQAAAGDLIQPYAKDGATAVQAVLDRWFEDSLAPHQSVDRAIRALGKLPLPGREDFLHRAVVEGRYVEAAAVAMGNTRDEGFIPDLASILTTQYDVSWQRALDSLSSFLSDTAAEALLDVSARLTDAEKRAKVLEAVESIRTYQEARERWASRRIGKQTRETAASDLAGMLSAKEALIRVEAAKGLATLGAIEALPQLIRLLQDPSEDVRKAAQEALDRLNRMAAQEQALSDK